jgi:hypothetical protein
VLSFYNRSVRVTLNGGSNGDRDRKAAIRDYLDRGASICLLKGDKFWTTVPDIDNFKESSRS